VDELPQLWNVLKADMSFVGSRPEVPCFVAQECPQWEEVLQYRPGITDLATVVYRNEEELLARSTTPEEYYRAVILPCKLSLNIAYHRSASLVRDLKLVLLTVFSSIVPDGIDPNWVMRAFLQDSAAANVLRRTVAHRNSHTIIKNGQDHHLLEPAADPGSSHPSCREAAVAVDLGPAREQGHQDCPERV
jgi:hypothetical protein